jgi:hypothetical protein
MPSIDIIRTDSGKRVHILDHAILPAWSPDGRMCAYIRRGIGNHSLEVVSRRGQAFSEPRELHSTGPVTAAPFWESDGRSILVVAERTTSRSREYEVARCALEIGEPGHVLTLVSDPVKRVAKFRGIAIDFDKDAEVTYYAPDLENRDSELIWTMLRDPRNDRRSHPVDPSLRIGAIAVSPDGRCVAMRLGDPDSLSHPALCGSEGEQTSLLVPDETARREWLEILATTAARALKGGLPAVSVGGETLERPVILPLPGELAGLGKLSARLSQLAQLAESVLPAGASAPEDSPGEVEARLLFDYVRGNIEAATADLAVLDRETTGYDQRLSILSMRALMSWARGDQEQARATIAYLVSSTGTATERIEYTPLGPVISKMASPAQAWAGFLSLRAEQAARQVDLAPAPEINDVFDPLTAPGQRRLPELPDFPRFEPGGAPAPFAPLPAEDFDPRAPRPPVK